MATNKEFGKEEWITLDVPGNFAGSLAKQHIGRVLQWPSRKKENLLACVTEVQGSLASGLPDPGAESLSQKSLSHSFLKEMPISWQEAGSPELQLLQILRNPGNVLEWSFGFREARPSSMASVQEGWVGLLAPGPRGLKGVAGSAEQVLGRCA